MALTLEEVAKHDTKEDCYMIIGNSTTGGPMVYNISSYLEDHPGGSEILMAHAGQYADEEFEDLGHSQAAIDELKAFLVGPLDETDAAKLNDTREARAKMGVAPPQKHWMRDEVVTPLVRRAIKSKACVLS